MNTEKLQDAETPTGAASELSAGLAVSNWTEGLTNRAGNALKRHGFKSKTEVFDEFMRCDREGIDPSIDNIGKRGIIEIRRWLELPPREIPPPQGTLGWAIRYCEDNGYTVTANDSHEGRTAALSPGVPLDAVVRPTEVKNGH